MVLVLLAQVLGHALAAQEGDGATLAALGDPEVARAVRLVRDDPRRAWTVGELAAAVSLSRSAFAARFRTTVGESPIRYLRRCRLAAAAGLLERTDRSLADIAAATGYDSEFALSRAFKREFGVAPSAYRGGRGNGGAPRARHA